MSVITKCLLYEVLAASIFFVQIEGSGNLLTVHVMKKI